MGNPTPTDRSNLPNAQHYEDAIITPTGPPPVPKGQSISRDDLGAQGVDRDVLPHDGFPVRRTWDKDDLRK